VGDVIEVVIPEQRVPQYVTYQLTPGGTADLGRVALRPYQDDEGKVRVRLIGADNERSYTVEILAFGRGIVATTRPVTGDYIEIENMPYGRFLVAVRASNPNAIWQEHITLTPEAFSAELEFDVSAP
jgi:hypothetical protein